MKKIIITNGLYGYRPTGAKYPEPKRAGDSAFPVEDAEAARLVKLGVAAYADTESADRDTDTDETPGGIAYSVDTHTNTLKRLLKECEIPYEQGMSREAMVAALDAYHADKDSDDEGPPDLGAADPVT